jgi:hypothetical protein
MKRFDNGTAKITAGFLASVSKSDAIELALPATTLTARSGGLRGLIVAMVR